MIKLGDTIDNRYNIISLLGEGGMAEVFECRDIINNKVVALKIMKEELLNDKESFSNFTKEIKASVLMSHQNIVSMYEDGTYLNRPYLVMEYLESQTLLDKIEFYTKFGVKEACEIMIQLLDAVDYSHKHQIIHRDIKPQNIFYLPNGLIKLADFGIASKTNIVDSRIIGSIHYLAPEVLTGKPYSIHSDIYACGVTFYQLLTGILPFDGTSDDVAHAHLKKEFPLPSNIVKTIPKDIDEIILKSVSKNPRLRYKNAGEFKDAIIAYLSGKKIKKSFFSKFF